MHLNKNESTTQNSSPQTNSEPAQNAENTTISSQIGQPIALPPKFGETPSGELEQAQATQYMPNGLPALKPKGVNVDTLFAENIKDSGKRFNRVEDAVVDLRKEFETYKPAIVRLSAVEADIQNLIKELEVLLQETPANQPALDLTQSSDNVRLQVEQLDPQPPPHDVPSITDTSQQVLDTPITEPGQVANATPPPPAPPKATAKPKPTPAPDEVKPVTAVKQYDGLVAQNIRVGEHSDKVRLVMDINKHTDYSVDLDNNEKLMIIELPSARWVGDTNKTLSGKLIESYSIESINDGKGSMIIIALKKQTNIIQEKRLSPDSSSPFHRIYFDLKP